MVVHVPQVRRTAEPLYQGNLPDKPCITLDEVINLIARHSVEIPEEEAKQIEDFVEKLHNNLAMSRFRHGLPPTAAMEYLYRRWSAASRLHWELMEYADRSPTWRNWSVTSQPVRLGVDDRKRAVTMLERMISYNRDRFNDFLSGREQLALFVTVTDVAAFGEDERKWLSCLGFETKEILAFLSIDTGANGKAQMEAEWIPTTTIVDSFGSWKAMPQHQRRRWAATFSNPAIGLKRLAQRSRGQGKEAMWNPIQVALWLRHTRKWPLRALDEVFDCSSLSDWRHRWEAEAGKLRARP